MNTSTPTSALSEPTLIPYLSSCESVFNVVAIVNAVVMIRALMTVKTLHVYFRTVSLNLFAVTILRSLTRCVFLTLTFTHVVDNSAHVIFYLSVFHWFCCLNINFCQVSLIVERAWSSIRDSNYEALNSKRVMTAYVLLPALAASLPVILTYGLKVLNFYMYLWFSVGFNFTITVLFATFLKFNSWKNTKNRRSWALSTRYQREENSRVSVTMKWFGFFCTLQNIMVTGFCLWILFRDNADSNVDRINWLPYAVTDFLISVTTVLYPIPFIATIEHIRRLYFQPFRCTEIQPNKVNVFFVEWDKAAHCKLYFRQLEAQWNKEN